MGFSTSGATLILFLGVLVSASVFFPSVEDSFEGVADATADRNERLLERRNVAVDVERVVYNSSNGTAIVAAANEGAVTLEVDRTDLLVNGSLQSGYATAVDGVAGRTLWAPGETLSFAVDGQSGPPARVELVTERGVKRVATNVTVVS
jgi:flagellar protein FlaF